MASTLAVCIGDTHFPFTNQSTLKNIYKITKDLQPKYIVQLGDLMDLWSASRWPKNPSYITPEEEYTSGRRMAVEFWQKLQKAAPKAKCHQIIGNHDERPKKKLESAAPELLPLLDVDKLYDFPGVVSQPSEREGLILEDILFMHGFRSKIGDHARHAGMSVVCGHIHRGGVAYIRKGAETIWELNTGVCGDTDTAPLSYSRQRHIATTTQGLGLIQDIGKHRTPIFIPFPN